MKIDPYLATAVSIPSMVFSLYLLVSCAGTSPGGEKTPPSGGASGLKDAVVKVSDEACKEVLGRDDEWVDLLCGIGSETIRVLLPRREWQQIRARKLGSIDAGPGK